MSFFDELLIARGFSECPTPLWKLKVTDDEYESLRQFLAKEYLKKDSFNGCAKEVALFYAEWWKRNPGESTDESQLIRDMGLTATEDAIRSIVENSRTVFDPHSQYHIRGIKLIISNRGREFKYSLFYQGGFPMGKACSTRGGVWSYTIRRFVRTDLNFDGLAGAKIAKKALKEYRTYFVDAACICLKKVDSQKESIIMTPHTEFQKKYYQQVIEIHQKTGFSPRKIAKLQLVPVSVRQMYHWIAIFEAENGKGSPRRIMEAKKSKEQEELESLKSRISELEESLRVERLRNRLNEKIIDIAEARWHIEIRKKAGTKR